jgi:hypothetical protein
MNTWTGFCLYVAAGVFIDHSKGDKSAVSASNLKFLLAAMKALGSRHLVTNHFKVKTEIEAMNAGMGDELGLSSFEMRHIEGAPKTIYNLYGDGELQGISEIKKRAVFPGILPRVDRDAGVQEKPGFPSWSSDSETQSKNLLEQDREKIETSANKFDIRAASQSQSPMSLGLGNETAGLASSSSVEPSPPSFVAPNTPVFSPGTMLYPWPPSPGRGDGMNDFTAFGEDPNNMEVLSDWSTNPAPTGS